MPRSLDVRRSIALTAAFVVTSWGAAAVPAAADHADAGNGRGKAVGHAKHDSQSQHSQKGRDRAEEAKSRSKGKGKGKAKGRDQDATAAASSGVQDSDEGKAVEGAADGDPLGNNGTVKIAPYGDIDGIPDNTPHPGCSFQVEWYGFDAGPDILSTVTFEMQSPTEDVTVSGTSPSQVFVGEDPATGAGTDSGLDAVQTYTLSFDGAPQEQQGYHVKLTVETPSSLGEDNKSKVFWVENCEDSGTVGIAGEEGTDDTEVLGIQATSSRTAHDTEVLGVQATAPKAAAGPGVAAADEEIAVPTAVEAGESNPFLDLVASPWGWALMVMGLGVALSLGAVVTRRASVRAHD